ncbi:MAG: AAA family ATPase [bacterium]|nr:AAA family ATPase [bacterium]
MTNPTIIAYLGKGGSGKSILSALTGKIACSKKKKVLLIDADPAMGLATALDISSFKTIGQAREEIIKEAKIATKEQEKENLTNIIDYLLLEALYETSDFSMLIMGQTNTIGCYCPINSLLKDTIKNIAGNYDIVVIDAEAGFEQINRQVTESVHFPVLLTDNTKRGVRTAIMASDTIKKAPNMQPINTGIIFNRVEEENSPLINEATGSGLNYYGFIKPDVLIKDRDAEGLSAFDMPEESEALAALKKILNTHNIIS